MEGLPAAFEQRIEKVLVQSISDEINLAASNVKALAVAISHKTHDCDVFLSKVSSWPFDLLASLDSVKIQDLADQFFTEQKLSPRSPRIGGMGGFKNPGLLDYQNLIHALSNISKFFKSKPLLYFDYQHDEYAQALVDAINKTSADKAIQLAADTYNARLIEGINSAGGHCAAFLSSFGAEGILSVASQPRTVFNLALRQFDENYTLGYGLDPVFMASRDNNIVLVSNTLQETHDMTVLAYLLSQTCHLSVVNAYFGANQLSAKYYQSPEKDLEQLQSILSSKLNSLYPVDFIQYANISLTTISTFLGRNYQFYEYYGKKSSETVFVS